MVAAVRQAWAGPAAGWRAGLAGMASTLGPVSGMWPLAIVLGIYMLGTGIMVSIRAGKLRGLVDGVGDGLRVTPEREQPPAAGRFTRRPVIGDGEQPQPSPGDAHGGSGPPMRRSAPSGAPRPVTLVVNPSSGSGGRQAEVRHAVADRPDVEVREVDARWDAGALARQAVREGAQVLAACGGDGTVSAVAAIAVEHAVPLIVVPCGTRNHFAKDCGIDVEDPVRQLGAIEGGHETRVDVGTVNGRVFLDNVSVGFYAAMVSDPEYRRRRIRVAARYVRRALLPGGRRAVLRTSIPSRIAVPEQLLTMLVSNNAYLPGVAPGSALRPRLDEGTLWIYLLGLPEADRPFTQRLLRGTGRLVGGRALVAAWPSTHQTITTDTTSIPTGIDGEPVELDTPLEFGIRPGALRLLQPSPDQSFERELSLRW